MAVLDKRPLLVAVAGPNGAGKSTFFQAHISKVGLHYINADLLAKNLNLDPYEAAEIADLLRHSFVERLESFAFETVLSDPVGEKVGFLNRAAQNGYNVVLCFIGISGPKISEQRVAMRVSQGGHDVPSGKLRSRFPRIMKNLKLAIKTLPQVWIFDNHDLEHPFRKVGIYEKGRQVFAGKRLPKWLKE